MRKNFIYHPSFHFDTNDKRLSQPFLNDDDDAAADDNDNDNDNDNDDVRCR